MEFWISLSLEKQPGSLVSFFLFSAIVAERGKKKKTPPVALVGAVAVLLEPPFENLASRRTASVLASAPLHTQDTQRLVWVPWCDSRNRASQYQIEAASWQRRADRMRAE